MLRRLLSVPNGDRKRAVRRILLPLGPAMVVLFGGYFYFTGGRYVSTENAYVKTDLVAVSAEISGPISEIGPDDNMPVTRGEMLFAIDPRPFEIARNRTHARLDLVRDEIEGLKALYGQKTQELAIAQTDLEFAEREYGRQSTLASNGFASRSKLDEVHTGLQTARQRIGALTLERQQILNRLSGDAEIAFEMHPSYLEAMAANEDALLDLERTKVRAPFDGIVVKAPELGQYVRAGQPVMSVVGTADLWIEANFKETDLANVRAGQKVEVRVDTYGGRTWQGYVESIAQASGAEVSILPPQNATGNWVKVVQRIPVRVRVVREDGTPPLRAGMSTRVIIDTQTPDTEYAKSGAVKAAQAGTGN